MRIMYLHTSTARGHEAKLFEADAASARGRGQLSRAEVKASTRT